MLDSLDTSTRQLRREGAYSVPQSDCVKDLNGLFLDDSLCTVLMLLLRLLLVLLVLGRLDLLPLLLLRLSLLVVVTPDHPPTRLCDDVMIRFTPRLREDGLTTVARDLRFIHSRRGLFEHLAL